MNPEFWTGKKVFLTGHTGFKGSWISLLLNQLGAKIHGYALSPPTNPNLYEQAGISNAISSTLADVRNLDDLKRSLDTFQPEVVMHFAAQSLVKESYINPVSTYETNIIGTVNILEAVRTSKSTKALVIVTSDKCYKNKGYNKGFVESDELGGYDPYSNSKACAELVVDAYSSSFFNVMDNINIASVRAGNVIGGGDWATDRLIPDLIRSFLIHEETKIRSPDAIRPWQHVLDPLFGYLHLTEQLCQSDDYSGAWNFGPSPDDEKPVSWIADRLCADWGDGVTWHIDKNNHPHESEHLHLDCTKAMTQLNWRPKLNLEHALDLTLNWYKKYHAGLSASSITNKQISDYLKLWKLK